jgi:hypothetical protein
LRKYKSLLVLKGMFERQMKGRSGDRVETSQLYAC